MKFFGFEIKRSKEPSPPSVIIPSNDDGSILNVENTSGYYGQYFNLEAILKNENDLIRKYREISQYPDCDSAVEDIVNESIIVDHKHQSIDINLEDLDYSDSIKKKIRKEFDNVLTLLEFEEKGHDIFRNWYIDGRLYYQILIQENNRKEGIVELRYIDPRKIKKIKNIVTTRDQSKNIDVVKSVEEYYVYNDKGVSDNTKQGIKLSLDSVIYCPSGNIDNNTGMMLGYLHKAIKPVNQLKMMEDALVIYRIARAPERRIFYVDVGNLPKIKAEQYVNDLMNRYRNKIVYDPSSGEVKDDRKHLSMMEDFWMPRREGGRGTEITTLPGGQTLGQIDDIQYFQKKLYQALNVPSTRMNPEQGFGMGRATEISRDEVKFAKFIGRLRKKFSTLFADALRVQLIAKGIISAEDWEEIKPFIRFDYKKDNYYSELKESELIRSKLDLLTEIDPFVGRYYSVEWVRRNVLYQNDDDIKMIDNQIDTEQMISLEHEQKKEMMQMQMQANLARAGGEQPENSAPQEQPDSSPQGGRPEGTTSNSGWPN